jgi:hypothetical protein
MTTIAEVTRILEEAEPGLRVAYFASLLVRESQLDPDDLIVVGGSAIEVYTRGGYSSGDIDVVVDRERVLPVLRSWAFQHASLQMWFQPDWKLTVDLVRGIEDFHGSRDRTEVVRTPFGPLRIEGIEDCVVKRLISARYWEIPEDLNLALAAARTHEGEIDWDYAERVAEADGVGDLLAELRKRVG